MKYSQFARKRSAGRTQKIWLDYIKVLGHNSKPFKIHPSQTQSA